MRLNIVFADHIPKTPGPVVVSDKESDGDQSNDGKDDANDEEAKNKSDNESESESDSSSSHSESSNDNNNRNSQNDSEVERSDNENEENEEHEDDKMASKEHDKEENEDVSSDDNEENADIIAAQSQDNDSDEDEEVQRNVSPKKKRQLEDNSDSSDESSDERKRQRKESIENNDNDENEDKDEEEDDDTTAKAKDIFGDMSSEDEEDNDKDKEKDKDDDERDSDKQSVNENSERRDEESGDDDHVNRGETIREQSFVEDEEPVEEPVPEIRIEVEIPRIVADLGREVHFVKLPNFLSIDTHPYDPQWYEDEIDEDENLDDEGRARLKLKVENTIRWRNVVDKETNELKRESNTRVVRWSDGSHSLHLGEEIFDIHKLPLMTGDNNHLFIRQGTGLQGQTVFRTKLNFRPFSTESFTHRKLTLSLADRSQKTQKIRVLPNVGKDPEAHRTEMIKKEEDRLKASIRRESKQRRVRERSLVRGPTASYLEPDEDEEEGGISIARIKDQYKRGSFTKSYDEPEYSPEDSKQANDDDSDDVSYSIKDIVLYLTQIAV